MKLVWSDRADILMKYFYPLIFLLNTGICFILSSNVSPKRLFPRLPCGCVMSSSKWRGVRSPSETSGKGSTPDPNTALFLLSVSSFLSRPQEWGLKLAQPSCVRSPVKGDQEEVRRSLSPWWCYRPGALRLNWVWAATAVLGCCSCHFASKNLS